MVKKKKPATKKATKEAKPTPWRYSKAKELLTQDIVDGTVEDWRPPSDVLLMRPEYAPYEYENFVTNLRTLRKGLIKQQELADADAAALAHDLALGI